MPSPPGAFQGHWGEPEPTGSNGGDDAGPAIIGRQRLWSLTAAPANTSKAGTKRLSTKDYTTARNPNWPGVATGATAKCDKYLTLRDRPAPTPSRIGTVTDAGSAGRQAGYHKRRGHRTKAGHGAHHRQRQLLMVRQNINLPGVNADGTQNTTGSAADGQRRAPSLGGTGKSVDGSANVAWTLAEIGTAPVNATTDRPLLPAPYQPPRQRPHGAATDRA